MTPTTKVFLIHGFNGAPNSSWLPWLMSELKSQDIYACSLPMPKPNAPICSEWISEIARQVSENKEDKIYLVGHSLGVAAILNYLQQPESEKIIDGAVLVSGRCQKSTNPATAGFYEHFDFELIKPRIKKVAIIHGDNDDRVLVENAYMLGEKLGVNPIIIENGEHLTGSQGWRELPQCLEALKRIME